MMIRTVGTTLAALLGLAFGSFLNVCLSRWPQGEAWSTRDPTAAAVRER